jgi:hypothetical protein
MLMPVLLTFLVSTGAAKADLIVNGSFEAPGIASGTQAEYTGNQIPGWTVLGNAANAQIFDTNYKESQVTFNAQSGTQSIDVSGTTNIPGQGVSQTVATQSGQEYKLSFYVGNPDVFNPSTGAVVNLSINNGLPVSYVNTDVTSGAMNWKQFTVDFVATGSSTTLAFTYGSAPPNYVSALDNVTMAAVPEPASLTLVGIGVGCGVIRCAYRRRKGAQQR